MDDDNKSAPIQNESAQPVKRARGKSGKTAFPVDPAVLLALEKAEADARGAAAPAKPVVQAKPEAAPELVAEAKPEVAPEPVAEAKPEVATELEVKAKPETATELEVKAKPEVATELEGEAKPEVSQEPKPETTPDPAIDEAAAALEAPEKPEALESPAPAPKVAEVKVAAIKASATEEIAASLEQPARPAKKSAKSKAASPAVSQKVYVYNDPFEAEEEEEPDEMPDVLPADTPFPKGELIAIATPSGIVLDANPSAKSFYSNDALAESWRKNPFTAFLHFGFEEKDSKMEPSVAFVHSVSRRFAKSLSQDNEIEFTREAKALDDEAAQEIAGEAPFMIGAEYISDTWAKSFWDGLRAAFVADLMQFSGTVKEYLNSRNPKLNVVGRIYFHLVENKRDETGDFPFAFLATYSTNNQAVIKSANKRAANGKSAHVPLKCALNEFGQSNDTLLKLLSTVSQAADKSDFISSLVESGELFSPLRFDTRDAYTFLKEIPVYEECGIMCRIPAWWRKKRKGVSVDVRIGTKNPSRVGIEAILSCIPVLMLDGEEITEEELLAMLEMSAGLVMIKGKWVEVDKEKLQEALAAYQNALAIPSMSMSEALRLQLGMETLEGTEESDVVSVSFGEWLKSVKERMAHPERTPAPALGKSFKAKLRGYQQVGYSWLMSMKSLGFGALLADDMGLGKTVQILAMLEATRQNGDFKCLLVVPASLVTNWEKEIEKFAPELKRKTIHPSFKTATPEALKDASLFITTYGMASRLDYLQQVHWDLLILDEAQAIKNAGTKQTKSVKLINASFKVAMTGTPVENRLTDLWSIFDFLNAGMLGSTKQFADYAADLKESGSYSKLRDTINPFILRRLKTDKTIISDLPDKIEMKDYPQMSKRQASLYKQTLDELVSALNDVEETSIQRKGLVLGSLMRFKQICNHPDQFLGQMEYQEAASGKFPLLREICETIIEKREKVLVFTQFKSIAEPLAAFLESVFHKPGLVIHGGTPVKLRGIYVDKFNNEPESAPFMVLSLKAGGVGLNLTAANHVIHFDRWWNPAVENQATDRAFRIGQTKNVIVHKFITAGTIEEKIDELIEDKLQLSNELIESSTGEAWIANMSNKELLKLLQMR